MQTPSAYRPQLPKDKERTASVGVSVLLGACGVILVPLLALFVSCRWNGEARPFGVASPGLVLLGTAAFAGGTIAIHRAVDAIRRAKPGSLGWLCLAGACAAAILSVDAASCVRSYRAAMATEAKLAALSFGISGLHAAYVIAALVAIALVARGAARGSYGPGRFLPPRLLAMHWTFIATAWAAIFAVVHLS